MDAHELDCRLCGLPLQHLQATGSPVGYYRCPGCDRQIASTDSRALRAAAVPHRDWLAQAELEARERARRRLRERLDRFLARAERAVNKEGAA